MSSSALAAAGCWHGTSTAAGRAFVAAWLLGALPAGAGVVFVEAETIDNGAGRSQQVRDVLIAGDDCRIVIRESTDPLAPAGAWILASATDAFIVDPARKVMAPLDPTDMEPVADAGEPSSVASIGNVGIVARVDEPGPVLLGLPTRHYVYVLRYEERLPGGAGLEVHQWEERHEFWATPWPDGGTMSPTWRRLRMADDAGGGRATPKLRAALAQMYDKGLFLRQIISRDRLGGPGGAAAEHEVVDRAVSVVGSRELNPDEFRLPEGYALAEFLAPMPDVPGPVDAPVSVDRPLPAPSDATVGP